MKGESSVVAYEAERGDPDLHRVLDEMERFPIDRLKEYSLQRRVDTKFVYPARGLANLLSRLRESYRILPAGDSLLADYRTLYFDTPERAFFRQHHRGQRGRFKVRIRHYLDRRLSYLEVKCKTNRNVTVKTRVRQQYLKDEIAEEQYPVLCDTAHCDPAGIIPQLWTNFSRITLMNRHVKERLTIDVGLEFSSAAKRFGFGNLAVIEIKQPRFSARSPVMLALRKDGSRPSPMSKYCTAHVTLHPEEVCFNRFKPAVRRIMRLEHD